MPVQARYLAYCSPNKSCVINEAKGMIKIMRDKAFIRGQVPMTNSEAWAVPISKPELCDNRIVYDIGAGTGSVAVETALAMAMCMPLNREKKGAG